MDYIQQNNLDLDWFSYFPILENIKLAVVIEMAWC